MKLQAQIESWLHQQWSKKGVFSLVMRPLSKLARYYIKYQSQQPRAQLPFSAPPIIVVGNIIVGGAGKTPVVLALCEYLKNQGWQPGIISRGYGVTINGPARVGQGILSAADFGDEPSLIAQQTGVPIAVHPQRVQALTALCQQHPEVNVVIADDGLQHQALPRDIEIIVQDQRGIGNGLVYQLDHYENPLRAYSMLIGSLRNYPLGAPCLPHQLLPQQIALSQCAYKQLKCNSYTQENGSLLATG